MWSTLSDWVRGIFADDGVATAPPSEGTASHESPPIATPAVPEPPDPTLPPIQWERKAGIAVARVASYNVLSSKLSDPGCAL